MAGIGGVIMNVLMTKMVADWFTGKEISTAMAIFVNSWPIGIAISLLMLPPIGVVYGASGAYLAVAALMSGLYQSGQIERASWFSCCDGRILRRIDMGLVQYRLYNDFRLWPLDAS